MFPPAQQTATPSPFGMPPSPTIPGALAAKMGAPMIGNTKKVDIADDAQKLELFKRCKEEAFADRWIFERHWTKVLNYLSNRQWLAPYSRTDGWRDARLAKGIPRPTTNKPKEADQSIRAMFTAIKFGVNIRPTSQSPSSITSAATADDLAPILHELHDMDQVMHDFDYWFVNNGNAILHSCWDYSANYGKVDIPYEQCVNCKKAWLSSDIANAKQRCPACNERIFIPFIDPATQEQKVQTLMQGGAVTTPLSLLEVAFPFQHARWRDVPFLIRMRWREKRYYEENPALKDYVDQIAWQKTTTERSLQIFQSLPFQNDMPSSRYASTESSSSREAEGIAEYELWMRPTPEHPEGLVLRVAGDSSPMIIHNEEDEGLPGPIPYHDSKGNPLFTFSFGGYQHVGGRVIASGAHDPVMSKYDALNRLDSLIEMIVMRMASPQWMLPKGSEIQWLGDSPGLPGLLLQWNSQIAGAAGRPEKVPGMPPDSSLIALREQLARDIEDGLGTYDIIKGAKPSGVEAFSALQLLVERGQQRFANAFMARGKCYRDWVGFALELEREFGPDKRTMAVMSPARGYAFKTFKKADLRGEVTIVIEDGTYTPKTSLGERAAIEHLNQLGILDPKDPDQTYTILTKFGQTALIPTLNAHVQAALKKQEDFEAWMAGNKLATYPPGTPPEAILNDVRYPLKWRRWYDPHIHRQEFLKWANSDAVQEMILRTSQAEGLLTAHLMEIDIAIMEQQMGSLDPGGNADAPQAAGAPAGAPGGGPGGAPGGGAPGGAPPPAPAAGGAGMAMANSNRNSGGLHSMPGGPAMRGAQAPI